MHEAVPGLYIAEPQQQALHDLHRQFQCVAELPYCAALLSIYLSRAIELAECRTIRRLTRGSLAARQLQVRTGLSDRLRVQLRLAELKASMAL